MSLSRTIVLFITTFLLTTASWSQPLSWYGKPKPYAWAFGIGWNFVEDDGRGFCQPFDVNQSWNGLPYPTRLTVDKYLKHGLSVEFAGAYNNYKLGKLINDSINRSGMFLSFDINCKYSFYNMIDIPWLDPYASLGLGLTQRNALDQRYTFTGNVAFGVNFWLYKGFGINLQTSGKIGLTGDFMGPSNYFQHSIGLVYKLQPGSNSNDHSFNKRQYKWTNKKMKYKSSRKNG